MTTRDDESLIKGDRAADVTAAFLTQYLPGPELKELPEAPRRFWRRIGPDIIAAGVGLASGEIILYPYIASQVGLVFVWAALVGLSRSSSSTWRSSDTPWPQARRRSPGSAATGGTGGWSSPS